jgi:hypothetical protein
MREPAQPERHAAKPLPLPWSKAAFKAIGVARAVAVRGHPAF